MIKELNIDNFQSHEKSTLVFTDNLNCITGVSDSGKSSIIRALRSLFKKSPMYIRSGTNSATVSAKTSTFDISRTRKESRVTKCPSCKEDVTGTQVCKHCGEVLSGKQSEDKYTIDSSEYEKFGASLPDFILDKTRIRPIQFGDFEYDLNFANQHDDMFFIGNSFSGGTRNKLIMSLCKDSDIIDVLIKDFRSNLLVLKGKTDDLIQENQKIDLVESTCKTDVDILRELQESTSELESILIELQDVELPLLYSTKKALSYSLASTYLSDLDTFSGKLVKISDKFPDILKFEQGLNDLTSLSSTITKYSSSNTFVLENFTFDLSELSELCNQINQMNTLSETIGKLKNIPNVKLESFDMFDLSTLFENVEQQKQLNTLNTDIAYGEEKIQSIGRQVSNFDTSIADIKIKIESTCKNGICPLIQDKFCKTCIPKLINS